MVIVGTANHFIIDAVGGAAVLVLGFARPVPAVRRTARSSRPTTPRTSGCPIRTYPGEHHRRQHTPADADQA